MRLTQLLCLVAIALPAHALQLDQRFEMREQFDGVTNFEDVHRELQVAVSPTELRFEDINPQSIKELQAVFQVKKEFGKMFGFSDWTPGRQQLFENPQGRFFLLEGNYKSNQGKTVYFLEIYHADRAKGGGEYLVTSDVKPVALEDWQKVFKP